MTEEKLRLSYSKAQKFKHCRREYDFYYNEGLIPREKAWPLKLGDVVHFILHMHDKNEIQLEEIQDYNHLMPIIQERYPDEEPDPLLQLVSEASSLCTGYIYEHKDSDLKIIPGESMLQVDMGDYDLVAIIDAWARPHDNKLFRLERKSTKRLDQYFLSGLRSGFQGAIYDYVTERLFEEELHGTIYDMLVKTKEPKFPRQFTKIDRTSIELALQTLDGVYRDIKRGDFYPSTECFRYNSTCAYRVLCAHDSPSARESFFTRRKEDDAETNVDDAGDQSE